MSGGAGIIAGLASGQLVDGKGSWSWRRRCELAAEKTVFLAAPTVCAERNVTR